MEQSVFKNLNEINVNEHVEKLDKGSVSLSYLSWAWAWGELMKRYPDATYEIEKFGDNQLPYTYDEQTGYMVWTKMTIQGITREMWLPVMNSNNDAMKSMPYTITTKRGERRVEAATMFDINKTIMRCLVKNIALFGLGLYIYAGEDLPYDEDNKAIAKKEEKAVQQPKQEKVEESSSYGLPNDVFAILKKYRIPEETFIMRVREKLGTDQPTDEDFRSFAELIVKKNNG